MPAQLSAATLLKAISQGEGAFIESTQGGMAVMVFRAIGKQSKSEQPESGLALATKVLMLLTQAKGPMSKRSISATLGQKEVSGQLNKVIRTLVGSGRIEATIPDKLGNRLQQYRLAGAAMQQGAGS
jgi:hypothetical protein